MCVLAMQVTYGTQAGIFPLLPVLYQSVQMTWNSVCLMLEAVFNTLAGHDVKETWQRSTGGVVGCVS